VAERAAGGDCFTHGRRRRHVEEMSFRCDVLYLVEPLPALAERLRHHTDPGLAELLLEQRLFRRRAGGNSDWMHADGEAAAKLLFLASLREYTPLDQPAGFIAAFGSACVSVAVFDRWFRVRRFEVDNELELMEQWLRECPLPVESTGRFVVDR